MKFDTIIIGGGLSGLACGIRLASEGVRCAIISSGQSAIHFSSGSFDLLNRLPDGTEVTNPCESYEKLASLSPEHPYTRMGRDRFMAYSSEAPSLFERAGMKTCGSNSANHYRITPMGIMKPCWLTLDGYMTSPAEDRLPWKDVTVINIEGFLDFYPEFIAEGLRRRGIHCRCAEISIPETDSLRRSPSEMRSPNLAKLFDRKDNIRLLADAVSKASEGCGTVILPAIIGISESRALAHLRELTGKEILLIPTLPPSIPGIQAQQNLQRTFRQLGGEYFLGDTVISAKAEAGRILSVTTANHGDISFRAANFVLATGSFFSKGLVATPDRIYEPVFGLDTDYTPDRSTWYESSFFAPQKYQSFGVRTDGKFRAMKDSKPLDNLYVCGAGLSGFNALKEGSGAGVSITSAFCAADNILGK